MRTLFHPTLVRRVVLALLIAVPLIWAALISFRLIQFYLQQQDDRHNFARSPIGVQMRDALGPVEDPVEARAIVAAFDRIGFRQRQRNDAPIAVVSQLWDRRKQQLIFSSPAVADTVLHGSPSDRTDQVVRGKTYLVFEVDTPRWSVFWARTRIDVSWIIRILDIDLFPSIAIAFPCLLLPAWLAVFQGLRPLRRFSERVADRGPGDLSPVGVDPKYAELKPLVASIDGLLVKLRHKVEAERQFVADAAHELRTPLAVITAQAHVLAKAQTEEARLDAELQLDSAIARASHLIHQLLVLARMDMERPPPQGTLDAAELVRQEIVQFIPTASARNIEISLEAPDRLMLPLEQHSFQSVVQNLMDNAIRYGHENGRVVVELQRCDGATMLSVADNGPGIADKDRPRVFDRFYRGASRDGASGTGLGLTIVTEATTRMGGNVRIASGLDERGCCFIVNIPDGSAAAPG